MTPSLDLDTLRPDTALLHRLREVQGAYIRDVSKRNDVTMSVEVAALACSLCSVLRARFVLDLGSGFSSCALRTETESIIDTVDHDPEWLAATRRFLSARNLDVERLHLWSDFSDGDRSYDFILHDLGGMERRAKALDLLWSWLAPGGVILLDDMHKKQFRLAADAFLARVDHVRLDVAPITTDGYGRYAYLVRRPAGAAA